MCLCVCVDISYICLRSRPANHVWGTWIRDGIHLLDGVTEFVGVVHLISLVGLVSSISLVPGGGNGHRVDPIIGWHLVLLLELFRLGLGLLHDEVHGHKEKREQEEEEEEIQIVVAVATGRCGTGSQVAITTGGGNGELAACATGGGDIASDVSTTGVSPAKQVERFSGSGSGPESDIDDRSSSQGKTSVDDHRVGDAAGSC